MPSFGSLFLIKKMYIYLITFNKTSIFWYCYLFNLLNFLFNQRAMPWLNSLYIETDGKGWEKVLTLFECPFYAKVYKNGDSICHFSVTFNKLNERTKQWRNDVIIIVLDIYAMHCTCIISSNFYTRQAWYIVMLSFYEEGD